MKSAPDCATVAFDMMDDTSRLPESSTLVPIRPTRFVAARTPEARSALNRLTARYGQCAPDRAECVVALGGDGFMLETLHQFLGRRIPVFGMNCGSVGFLMNGFREDNLPERLDHAEPVMLNPLRMIATTEDGMVMQALAFNEVSMLRQTRQAAKLRITVDGKVRMKELACDGVLVSTPAGSTAYNLSVQGPIIPLGANLLCLTPISAFRPRRWRGALLPHGAAIVFEMLEADKRPVSAVADHTEVRNVARVEVRQDESIAFTLLFDPDQNLEERVLKEQFEP